jgi:adenine-specific DNA-methyltransferase
MRRLLRASTYRARALRRASTPAEEALWQHLRNRQLDGAKFRRQQPIGPYTADFFCADKLLVIELDGAYHFPPPLQDAIRDTFFEVCGIRTLRFENCEVHEEPLRVLSTTRAALSIDVLPPSPSGRGVGGEGKPFA